MAALAVRGAERKETVPLSRVVEETGAQHESTEDGQGLWEHKKGAGDSAGCRRERRRDELDSEGAGMPPLGKRGRTAYKRELLGPRCSAGKRHGLFRRG